MVAHPNFYETIHETHMRLRGTFVMYDGEPYVVLCITNHRDDGIFRIYLEPIGNGEQALAYNNPNGPPVHNYGSDDPSLGQAMDKWMEKYPDTKIIRKMMNSPLFNKFRPFPLGMCNYEDRVFYLERQPSRKTEQGLTHSMVSCNRVNLGTMDNGNKGRSGGCMVGLYGASFRDCIKADHPSAQECLSNLTDREIINEAAAFHRQFALVRGPLDMIFLAYKTDIVGVLPNRDLSVLRLGREFWHTREVVDLLRLFETIIQN
jgi:hypothetical protein